ncbi:preprotein translocase subunit SecG [Aciditerrimonas ferrireducens]|uniref:Protein-export membrane protein SecG n=1 Tax=Aciditerrimonas ferrireducens TaxID=667306 RepID=A0ABV6C3N3_9ACTN|nr:preprotein translocase subunit SecG [Aciditerrimonas ferrireducens]MCK4176766.1 preprotein translocase subunit SecG [Aciditerrimonas ferrireducens]
MPLRPHRQEAGPTVLTIAVLVIQILSSVSLVGLVLLHSGKGGGLSDMFGGAVGQAAAGSTVVEKNLDRITITVALVFAFTTVALALRLQ